ncbi:hypothetical protein FM120_20605 [Sphingobacterium faecium PCAi_F2.5]|nr:hypothetical protein FM120_20605 [Sphingobacterium faecium PCAi_F2.5]
MFRVGTIVNMPKFGNINETNITDYPLWGNFYLWKGNKKG